MRAVTLSKKHERAVGRVEASKPKVSVDTTFVGGATGQVVELGGVVLSTRTRELIEMSRMSVGVLEFIQ